MPPRTTRRTSYGMLLNLEILMISEGKRLFNSDLLSLGYLERRKDLWETI
jgi:hypothetical protein